MISDLYHPKVRLADEPFLVSQRAAIPSKNARMSVAKCAQSVAMAIELAQ
jgi:hypothetical protein